MTDTPAPPTPPTPPNLFHHDDNYLLHIFPPTDVRAHVARHDCWCRPVPDPEEPYVFMHRSLDQRTRYDSAAADARPGSPLWG
jgi:hypothetical protein